MPNNMQFSRVRKMRHAVFQRKENEINFFDFWNNVMMFAKSNASASFQQS